MNITSAQLIDELSGSVERRFAEAIINSYGEMQQRFLAGDWQPAELQGGRLCEAVSWALFQLDTGKVDDTKSVYDVRTLLLDRGRAHRLSESDREHILKAIDAVYKCRSDRGAVHISPIHDANYMDAMFELHCGKWIVAEFLRLVWKKDKAIIGEVISQLVQLEHSVIHELDGRPMVLSASVTIQEEVLLLLHHAPTNRLNRREIGEYVYGRTSGAVSNALTALAKVRYIRKSDSGEYALTPLGQSQIRNNIIPKVGRMT